MNFSGDMARQKKIVIDILHPIQDYETVADLQGDEKLLLYQVDTDIQFLREYYGKTYADQLEDYDTFFVEQDSGDYDRVYAISGSVPYLGCRVTRLKTPSELVHEYIQKRDHA